MQRKRTKQNRQRSGVAMVELALILPTLLMLAVSIIDWAMIFYTYHSMYEAAREASRAMAIQEKSATEGETIANEYLSRTHVDVSLYTLTMTNDASQPSAKASVTLDITDASLVNYMLLPAHDMSVEVATPYEGL